MPNTETQLDRIERKLDQTIELQRQLVDALAAEEDQPQEQRTLEGESAGRERDQGQSLDVGD